MGSENCAVLNCAELRGVRSLRLCRHVLPVDGVARRRPDGGAVGGGARNEEGEQLCDHGVGDIDERQAQTSELTVSRARS